MRDLRLQIALSRRKIVRPLFAQFLRKHMLEDVGAQGLQQIVLRGLAGGTAL